MPKEKTEVMTVLYEQEVFNRPFKVYGTPQEPLFLAKDVAQMLEHKDVSMMIRHIDADEKVANIVCTPGGEQKAWFLTERGLYEVLFRSRKPIAKEFKAKVKDILYSIRTTGQYGADNTALAQALNQMLNGLALISETQKQIVTRLEKLEQNNQTAPKPLMIPASAFPDKVETINRKNMGEMVEELAELTGNTSNGILHQLYILLEDEMGVSIGELTRAYRKESGNRKASPFCMIAANDVLYHASIDALERAIKANSVFD